MFRRRYCRYYGVGGQMNYLVVPDNLKPRELLLYAWLYSNANHTTTEYKGLLKNEVYASSRLISADTEMSQQHASRTLTTLEENGYITCLFKSKKPNQKSKYFLDFNLKYKVGDVSVNVSDDVSLNESVDVSVQCVENERVEVNPWSVNVSADESVNVSVDASSSFNNQLMSLNNQKKQKHWVDYSDIFNHYNSVGLIKHQKLTEEMKKGIDLAVKTLGCDAEEMKRMIDRHKEKSVAMKDNDKFKIRPLAEFFGQKKWQSVALICSDYSDDVYESQRKQQKQSTQTKYSGFNDYMGES